MKLFGLVGNSLSHSFSKSYFDEKFRRDNTINCRYDNYEISDISQLNAFIKSTPDLKGLNITIPYKEIVIPYLSEIDETAKQIGAVNTIKIINGKTIGFNTDYIGFKQTLKPFLEISHERALILGTGGASKAVFYTLNSLNIKCLFVSRNPKTNDEIGYDDINEYVLKNHQIIVNTTPIGTFPKTNESPLINFDGISSKHLLYDLIYNPSETLFLKEGKKRGATTLNGLQMLKIQAEKAWEIWNN